VNKALQLLREPLPALVVARRLARSQGISERQARRYVLLAQSSGKPVVVPESKAVFTVKLPQSLIGRVRRTARRGGAQIGAWVGDALQRALPAESTHG